MAQKIELGLYLEGDNARRFEEYMADPGRYDTPEGWETTTVGCVPSADTVQAQCNIGAEKSAAPGFIGILLTCGGEGGGAGSPHRRIGRGCYHPPPFQEPYVHLSAHTARAFHYPAKGRRHKRVALVSFPWYRLI